MTTNTPVVFRKGKLVSLRPFEKADAPILTPWMNDHAVTRHLMTASPASIASEEKWIESLSDRKSGCSLGIVENATGRLIGSIGFHDVDMVHRTATTGMIIGDKSAQGKGYGPDAKMLLLHYAFCTLHLHVISARVFAPNDRSVRSLIKSGYVECGRLLEYFEAEDGTRHDILIFVITKQRWFPMWEEYRSSLESSV